MRSVVAFLALVLFGGPWSPSQLQSGTPAGKGSVAGAVTTADGRRLGGVTVTLTGGVPESSWNRATDSGGRFAFVNIPAGTYQLSATHPHYLPGQFGQRYPGGPGRSIQVGQDGRVQADVVLTRGGAVTGRVFDEHGNPMPDVLVRAYRFSSRGAQRYLVPAGGRSYASNDIGEYRISGLTAGEVLVAAQYRPATVARDGSSPAGYAHTWYPGRLSSAAAQAVRVTPNNDSHGVDFVLLPALLTHVSGAVVGSGGRPASSVQLWVTAIVDNIASAGRHAVAVAQDGSFRISDLAPGDYLLNASSVAAEAGSGPAGSPAQAWAASRAAARSLEHGSIRVTVNGQPVQGQSIQLRPASRVSIAVESEAAQRRGGTVSLLPREPWAMALFLGVEEGRSTFAATPGQYDVRASVPPGWFVEQVVVGGTDVTRTAVVVREGFDVNARVRLSSRGASIVGRAVNGTPPDVSIVVMAEAPADRIPGTDGVRLVQPEPDGRFGVTGLRPGTYLVAAIEAIDSKDDLYDPRFWQQFEGQARRMTLLAGQTMDVSAPFVSRR